jgi:6,7-dimethyl-8-ribityllumazine synthase
MKEIREIAGNLSGSGRRFGIVASRFNGRIVEPLLEGATDCLTRHGVAPQDIVVARVPGAWEIPAALEELAAGGTFAALVALGVVIRGETPHFDYICAECSRGIAAVSDRHRLAIGFGVLTCDTPAQAQERAGGKAGNKGWDASLAALEMADLLHRLRAD